MSYPRCLVSLRVRVVHSLSDLTQCTCRIHVVWSHSESHSLSIQCTCRTRCLVLRVRVVHSYLSLTQMYVSYPRCLTLRVRVVHSLSDLTQCTCRIHVVWSHSEYVLYTVYLISPNVHVVSTLSGLTQSTCCTQFI